MLLWFSGINKFLVDRHSNYTKGCKLYALKLVIQHQVWMHTCPYNRAIFCNAICCHRSGIKVDKKQIKGRKHRSKPLHSYNTQTAMAYIPPLLTSPNIASCLITWAEFAPDLFSFSPGLHSQDCSYCCCAVLCRLSLAKSTVPPWHPKPMAENTKAIEPRGAPPGSAVYTGTSHCLCWHSV